MKKLGLSLAILSVILTGGCGFTDTPTELMRAPAADGNQQSINQAVMQFLPPGSQLTVPLHPEESSAVSLQDLTGDGSPEVIAFYKTEKTDYEIGVLVLTQSGGNWKKAASFSGIGRELDYVQYVDLTGDGIPEMLIGWGGGDGLNKELSVYSFKENTPQELLKQSYTVMAVGDLIGDEQQELTLIIHDHSSLTSKAEVYGATDNTLTKWTEISLEGSINGYEKAIIGKASATTKGIFIEAGLGAHSAMTELLIFDDGHLRRPLANLGEENPTFKPYSLYSEDINGDGIIEIGIHTQPPGTDDLSMAEIPWIASYYQWDGGTGLTHVEDHFQSYNLGFDFRIPEKWKDKFTVERNPDPGVNVVHMVYNGQNGENKATLLTFQMIPQQEWAKMEKSFEGKQTPYLVLSEASKKVLVAIQPQKPGNLSGAALREYNSLLLTTDEIRQLFRPLKMPL
ncbi:VCBS repeat-containing protein [Brevibacillus ruminantium]|uniref:VCBS repeat-containing protein n=1 Tax=Brevibacillus ruminantium TaxID=2950604 RepID=A0ABY4WGI5_9BACL|nr:VCBS repeat-containing protein [Brevibacillus ruminantium]USG66261.1 VCBS repeat-containing protein [Brevibacillus ruminantium]